MRQAVYTGNAVETKQFNEVAMQEKATATALGKSCYVL